MKADRQLTDEALAVSAALEPRRYRRRVLAEDDLGQTNPAPADGGIDSGRGHS